MSYLSKTEYNIHVLQQIMTLLDDDNTIQNNIIIR